jgi:hypothetical protein
MKALRILQPCNEPIEPSGDGRTWACDKCRTRVVDLSLGTEEQAEEWVRAHAADANACVKLTQDSRGMIVFRAAVVAAAISASACSAADFEGAVNKLTTPAPAPVDAGYDFSSTYYGFVSYDDPTPPTPAPSTASSVHAHCNAGLVPPKPNR